MLKELRDGFKKKFKSQEQEVLWLLQNNKAVMACTFAMEYGILRYGQHIHTLRKKGHKIEMLDKYVKKDGRQQRITTYKLLFS